MQKDGEMPGTTRADLVLSPLTIRGMTVTNRIMMSPMSQHRGLDDGRATDWHLVHYGARAAGGIGLIMVEDCAVSPEGRLGTQSLGLYSDSHIAPLRRIVDYCHAAGSAIGIQLGHAGRKAFGVQGPPPGTSLLSASGEPFFEEGSPPRKATERDWDRITDDFVTAALRARAAGFDALEVHGAHGYLLHEATYATQSSGEVPPLRQVVQRVRAACGESLAIFARISAGASAAGDLSLDEAVTLSTALEADGADVVDVSSGGLVRFVEGSQPDPWPRVAEHIRQRTSLKTIGLGGVSSLDDAELLLAKEACDLVGVGRALLHDPYWLIHEVPTA
jgi:NADPH2 dehydrogenase